MTVQNEPAASQTWESCIYSPEEERDYACDYLKPSLEKSGFGDVKINIWEHNKEIMIERARKSISTEKAMRSIDGIAFHWYTGDFFDAVSETKNFFQIKN